MKPSAKTSNVGRSVARRVPVLGRALRSWQRRGRESNEVVVATRDLLAGLSEMVDRLDGLDEQIRGVDAWVRGLDLWIRGLDEQMRRLNGELDRRLRATQALVARIYEAPPQWPEQVRAMRLEDDFEQAWEGEPLITVRIATYNNAEILVERTLPSLLRQTYRNWEAIIIGDACTDDTGERVAAIGDPRISFENRPIRGPYPEDETSRWFVAGIPGMNRALERARGAWIAALDHDDEWDEDHLEVLLAEAKRTRAEIVYGKWRMRDASNGRLIDEEFGDVFPPMEGLMAFQASLCHGKLSRFHYDMNAYLADEPGDKNLARRLWEAGVKFAFLDRAVVTYWFEPRSDWGRRWREDMIRIHGYVEGEVRHA